MNILFFFYSLFAIAAAAWFHARMLRITGVTDVIIASYVFASANIVFSTIVLSELNQISSIGYLVIHTAIAFVSMIIYVLIRKHFAASKRGNVTERVLSRMESRPQNAVVVVLFIVIIVAAFINLILALYVPTNVYDSMTQHLSRVGYWLQNKSLHHFYSQNHVQNTFPPNAEIIILWTAAFLKSDILANVVQWIAYIGIGIIIYRTAIILGYRSSVSMSAALIYLSLPMVMLESTSTYNDLVVTFYTVSMFYFYHSGVIQSNSSKLLISGIACGLAVGTKYTLLIAAPAIVIASLVLFVTLKAKWSLYIQWVMFCIIGIVLFGAYNNYLNYKEFGHPVAPQITAQANVADTSFNIKKGLINGFRYSYDALDFRGLPAPAATFLNNLKKSVAERYVFSEALKHDYAQAEFSLDTPLIYFDTVGWFGLLGVILFLPVTVWFVLNVMYHRRFNDKWPYAFIAVGFFIFFCFLQDYTPYKSRYFVLPMAFIAPLTASVFDVKRKSLETLLLLVMVFIAIHTSFGATFNNISKPVLSSENVFNTDYNQQRAVFGQRGLILPFLRFVDDVTMPGDRIGHVIGSDSWDYPFFGRDFSRFVIPVKPEELDKMGKRYIIESYNLDFLIVELNDQKSAFQSLDPSFIASGPWGFPNFYNITPRMDWKDIIRRSVTAKNDFDRNLNNYIGIFWDAWNYNTPLKTLIEYADQHTDSITLSGKKYAFSSRQPLIKLSASKDACSILTPAGPDVDILLSGRTNGARGVIQMVDESGETISSIPLNKNGEFTYSFAPGKKLSRGDTWDIVQMRIPDTEKGNFFVTSDALNTKSSLVIDLLNGSLISSTGFYDLEGTNQLHWKWTNGNASINFTIKKVKKGTLIISAMRPAKNPEKLRIIFNNRDLNVIGFTDSDLDRLEFRIPSTWFSKEGVQSLRFVNKPFNPAKEGINSDTRNLGLRIFSIQLEVVKGS